MTKKVGDTTEQHEKEELERKDAARSKMNDIVNNIDVTLEKASLLANFGQLDDSLAAQIADDQAAQDAKNA